MTKEKYIQTHPNTILAANLKDKDWPNDTPIEIIDGVELPNNQHSNLFRALQQSHLHEYVVGEASYPGLNNVCLFAVA